MTMMMMKNPMILMTCTLLFSSLAVLASQGSFAPDECCFRFFTNRLPMNRVASYMFTDDQCKIQGVLFTTNRGVRICADPSLQWVQNLIKAKDQRQNLLTKSIVLTPHLKRCSGDSSS
ncbi:C-C motif chemokine 3-like [Anoplopoma fimbria]|uniref:C-C motif chemokine 3-like n=1 Tax=Anoplopoma fimbria TaxID=229290 RepID=UPI0023EB10A7|nr:C-C motif chemokine 3-like [Anoplopoma fimbria]